LLDAGGFSRGMGDESKLQTEYLLKGLGWLGLTTFNVGVRDMMNGGEYLKSISKTANADFISSNIFYNNSTKQYFESSKVIKVKQANRNNRIPIKDIKIGVIGLCDGREVLFNSKIKEKPLSSRIDIGLVQQEINKLKKKSDLIVLLYHGKYAVIEQVAKNTVNVDLIIMGGEYYRADRSQLKNPILVSTPNMGKYLGLLELKLDKDKQILSHSKRRLPLKEDVADTEKYIKLAEECEEKTREMRQHKYSQKQTQ
jgi:2',3'-cyclic-nucleotide 2'-phosphodiesterase (5'-nucleotidase family)